MQLVLKDYKITCKTFYFEGKIVKPPLFTVYIWVFYIQLGYMLCSSCTKLLLLEFLTVQRGLKLCIEGL